MENEPKLLKQEATAGSGLSDGLGGDELTRAILRAGDELAIKYGWCFDGDPGCPPNTDNPFIEVVRKHVLPLVNTRESRERRIALLRFELSLLVDA